MWLYEWVGCGSIAFVPEGSSAARELLRGRVAGPARCCKCRGGVHGQRQGASGDATGQPGTGQNLTKLNDIKADDAVRALRVCFSDQGPWGTATGGVPLGDRIYQESYDWPQWVSYKHEARARKVSTYQFRAPGEWFAEAYAAYYQPPGAKGALLVGRDDATKAWFDANVDPRGGAGGTTPAAPGGAGGP